MNEPLGIGAMNDKNKIIIKFIYLFFIYFIKLYNIYIYIRIVVDSIIDKTIIITKYST